MWLIVALAFCATGVVTLWGISQFARIPQIPAHVFVPLFIATYIPTSIVVLVPIDLMSSTSEDQIFYISEHARLVIWRIFYWLTFVLTWLILPVLMYYVESGHYDPMRKLTEALRRNAKLQLILLGSGIVGLMYVVMTSGLSPMSIKSVVIALSYSYALVLAIWLLGHGLVNVPRELWTMADPHAKLSHLYQKAVKTCDAYAETTTNYDEVAGEIRSLRPFKDGQYGIWISELLDDVGDGPGATSSAPTSRSTPDNRTLTEEYMASLSRRYFLARSRANRCRAEWQKLLKDAAWAEDVIKADSNTPTLGFRYFRTVLSPQLAFIYYTKVHKYLIRATATLLAVMSIGLIWSELVHGTVASLVNLILGHTSGFWQQLLSGIFLAYMCWCAYSSLMRIRVFNIYALVHKGSDLQSLIFYGMYACRLTVPLSYNFLTLITSRAPVFEEFLGNSINLTPLGMYFNDWLPRFILIPIILTWFHFYDKVRDYLGFGLDLDDEDDSAPGSTVEGRELVARALTDARFRWAFEGLMEASFGPQQTSRSAISLPAYQDSLESMSTPSPRPSDAAQALLGRHGEDGSHRLAGATSFLGSLGSRVRGVLAGSTGRVNDGAPQLV